MPHEGAAEAAVGEEAGLLGEVNGLVGVGVHELVDIGRGAGVGVEGGAVYPISGDGVVEDGDGVGEVVAVVVPGEDAGGEAGLVEGGAEGLGEVDLVGDVHAHALIPVGLVLGLVLHGEQGDAEAAGIPFLEPADEVVGVDAVILGLQFTVAKVAGGFDPGGSGPGGAEDCDLGVELLGALDHGDFPLEVAVDGELGEGGVGLAGGEVVVGAVGADEAGLAHGDAEEAEADAAGAGEEAAHDLVAHGGVGLGPESGHAHGGSEALDGLEALGLVDDGVVGAGGEGGAPSEVGLTFEELGGVAGGDPDLDHAGGGRGGCGLWIERAGGEAEGAGNEQQRGELAEAHGVVNRKSYR